MSGNGKNVGLSHGVAHRRHHREMPLHAVEVLHGAHVVGVVQVADSLLDGLAVVHPLLQEGLGSRLGLLRGHALLGRLAAGLGAFRLPLAALGRVLNGRLTGW